MASKVVVEIPHIDGLPEHAISNTWVVGGETPTTAIAQGQLLGIIEDFYNSIPPEGNLPSAVGGYLSPALSRSALQCKAYLYDIEDHLDGSPHGEFLTFHTFSLPGVNSVVPLPSEVACVLTLEGYTRADVPFEQADGVDAGSLVDRPKQRRTGRVYIGPLNNAAATTVSQEARPSLEFLSTLRYAGKAMDNALRDASESEFWRLCMWSRVDATLRQIEYFSTDDAWDTQRRRGVAHTQRVRTLADV